MPNIGSLLRQEIARLSRREIRGEVQATKKASAQHRRHIAVLRRQIAALERQVASLQRRVSAGHDGAERASAGDAKPKLRFVANGLRSQRVRLGLTAGEYARLAGVSEQTIYNWEHGLSRPRDEHLATIAALRGLGKRAARSRLDEIAVHARRSRKRRPRQARQAAA